jgi:hypothetical protein
VIVRLNVEAICSSLANAVGSDQDSSFPEAGLAELRSNSLQGDRTAWPWRKEAMYSRRCEMFDVRITYRRYLPKPPGECAPLSSSEVEIDN